MKKYILVYRAGTTFDQIFSEVEQQQISRDWSQWTAEIGERLVDNSPVTRVGRILSNGETADIHVDKDLVNGYVIFHSESLDHAVDICSRCPLYLVGKTLEIRELPSQ